MFTLPKGTTISSVYCPDPPPVPHTTSHITGKSAGDVAMYQCELGYKLVGDPITTCQTSGLWTSAPSCDGKKQWLQVIVPFFQI